MSALPEGQKAMRFHRPEIFLKCKALVRLDKCVRITVLNISAGEAGKNNSGRTRPKGYPARNHFLKKNALVSPNERV